MIIRVIMMVSGLPVLCRPTVAGTQSAPAPVTGPGPGPAWFRVDNRDKSAGEAPWPAGTRTPAPVSRCYSEFRRGPLRLVIASARAGGSADRDNAVPRPHPPPHPAAAPHTEPGVPF